MGDSESEYGNATGFFYERERILYLVTCRHVLFDPKTSHEPVELKMRLHLSGRRDLTRVEVHTERLYDTNGRPLWLEHDNKEVDLALLKLDMNEMMSKFDIEVFSERNRFPDDFILVPSDDVFVIGYPLGFYDKVNNLPIFRHATIASLYGVPYNGKSQFLTDGKLHEGTSGAPIVTNPKGPFLDRKFVLNIRDGENYFLVGIHCGGSEQKDLELGFEWYPELIDEIIDQYEQRMNEQT